MTRRTLLSAAIAAVMALFCRSSQAAVSRRALISPGLGATGAKRIGLYAHPDSVRWLGWAEDAAGKCLGFFRLNGTFQPFTASSV